MTGVLLELSVIIGITNMEDGKHGLDELQGTRISTWAPSVSIRDVFFIVCRVLPYIYSPHTSQLLSTNNLNAMRIEASVTADSTHL